MAAIGSELPVPDLVDDLFGSRIGALTDPVRRALLTVSLSAGLTVTELSSMLDGGALEDAIAAGVLVVERSRVLPSHPMLAAAARTHATAGERRAVHAALADAVAEPALRARHLALATAAPDSAVAATVASAADLAARRGALHEAQELGALALRLTPRNDPSSANRLLALARFHSNAGDMTSLTELLTAGMAELPPGRHRALAHLLLAEPADRADAEEHVELALSDAAEDPEVRALALAKRALGLVFFQLKRVDEAESWLREALSVARPAGTEVESRVILALAFVRAIRGRSVEELIVGRTAPSADMRVDSTLMQRPLGVTHLFRGELARARATFEQILALADERGELPHSAFVHLLPCELELRAGNVRRAARLLEEYDQGPSSELIPEESRVVSARQHAILAAVEGDPEEVRLRVATILAGVAEATPGWDRLGAMRATGLAALLAHDPDAAVEDLQTVWEHTLREHVDDPGVFPVAGDLVEALTQVDRLDEATQVTEELRRRSEEQSHPWGLVTAKRCEAVLALAGGYDEQAVTAFEEAVDAYGKLGLGFDHARTLLSLGRIQRRYKKRAAARSSLEAAVAQFEQGGSPGWAEEARQELARVSGRRTTAVDELTPSERQVVLLAARGMSNREIAGELFVSVSNVESHLSHAYAKLGVRSRAELAVRVQDTDLQ
jgi:DNA-binding CsgD family transcriptional regulator